jgi:hypothetical protein
MQLQYSWGMIVFIYDQDMTKPRYVSANLTAETAAALRTLIAGMTIETGKRVTTSALISALIQWGNAHKTELGHILSETDDHEH